MTEAEMTEAEPRPHPAKFSPEIIDQFKRFLYACLDPGRVNRVLDPFAGVGGVHALSVPGFIDTVGVELEPEWARQHPRTIVGNATALSWQDEWFDAVVTSPCYGNRMADTYDGRDGSKRMTYRISLGRMPSEGSAATLQWGLEYCELHNAAWREVYRVLRPGGLFVLNVSDHIRKGERVNVSEWHATTIEDMGFVIMDWVTVGTRRMRMGSDGSRDLRVNGEEIIVARRP